MKGFQAIFGLDVSKAMAGFDKLQKESTKTGSLLKGIGKIVGPIGGMIAAAFSVGAIKGFIDEMGNLNHLAVQLGQSAKDIQLWEYLFQSVGAGAGQGTKALGEFAKKVGEAQLGTGELKRILEAYDIAVKNADGSMRSASEVFRDLVDAISEMQSQTEKAATLNKAFGEGWKAVNEIIKDGNGGLSNATREFEKLNPLTDRETRQMAELSQVFTDLGTFLGNAFKHALVAVYDAWKAVSVVFENSGMIFKQTANVMGLMVDGMLSKVFEIDASIGEFFLKFEKVPGASAALKTIGLSFDDIRERVVSSRAKADEMLISAKEKAEKMNEGLTSVKITLEGDLNDAWKKNGDTTKQVLGDTNDAIDNQKKKVKELYQAYIDGEKAKAKAALDAAKQIASVPDAAPTPDNVGGNGGGGGNGGTPAQSAAAVPSGFVIPNTTGLPMGGLDLLSTEALFSELRRMEAGLKSFNNSTLGSIQGIAINDFSGTTNRGRTQDAFDRAVERVVDELNTRLQLAGKNKINVNTQAQGGATQTILDKFAKAMNDQNMNMTSIMNDQLQTLSRISTKLDKSTIVTRNTP